MGTHQQRVVRIAEHGHVGHGQRTDGFAVVAVLQTHKLAPLRLPQVAPAVEALLECNLDRAGTVGCEEGVAQGAASACTQALGQAHGGLVGAAGQHHVGQGAQLLADGVVHASITVAEQVDPPGAVGVKVALPCRVFQPGAIAPGDGQRRQVLGPRHLCAGVPHSIKAAAREGRWLRVR